MRDRPVDGDTTAERVINALKRTTRGMQSDPQLTEALTRAFMFADSSVAAEIHQVGMLLTSMLTRAMYPEGHDELTEEDVAIARVIGDVWLSALVGWVTGRTGAGDVDERMDVAVRLLLRD
jgi:TetR/AcrR family transcriptional regulator, cholesterol catabolism regulator